MACLCAKNCKLYDDKGHVCNSEYLGDWVGCGKYRETVAKPTCELVDPDDIPEDTEWNDRWVAAAKKLHFRL